MHAIFLFPSKKREKKKQIKDNIYGPNFVQMWKIGSFINSFYGWPKRKKKG